MNLSIKKVDFLEFTSKQINNLFPDNCLIHPKNFKNQFDHAIDRVDFCFKRVAFERYNSNGQTYLNHLYSDQYLIYLWFLANTVWEESGNEILASKLYYLNKTLHGFDCMYDTNLPDIFLIFHGVGTMLGKAKYDDFFVALQGCTIGSQKGKYPVLGKGVALTANSSIIGDCEIGSRVSVSANSSLFQTNVPCDSVVYSDSKTGEIKIKPTKESYSQQFFNVDLKSL
jgi:serine O-acetyltransferase